MIFNKYAGLCRSVRSFTLFATITITCNKRWYNLVQESAEEKSAYAVLLTVAEWPEKIRSWSEYLGGFAPNHLPYLIVIYAVRLLLVRVQSSNIGRDHPEVPVGSRHECLQLSDLSFKLDQSHLIQSSTGHHPDRHLIEILWANDQFELQNL